MLDCHLIFKSTFERKVVYWFFLLGSLLLLVTMTTRRTVNSKLIPYLLRCSIVQRFDHTSPLCLFYLSDISLKVQTVPLCQNLYRNSFTYHCMQDDKTLQFDEAIQFLGMHVILLPPLLLWN
jgi:hypothetical protein